MAKKQVFESYKAETHSNEGKEKEKKASARREKGGGDKNPWLHSTLEFLAEKKA